MNLDFIGKRKLWYIIALSIIAIGIVSLAVQGLNFGIDFTGGTRLVLDMPGEFSESEIRDFLAGIEATDASGQTITLENSYIQRIIGSQDNEVVIRTVPLTEAERETLLDAFEGEWDGFNQDSIQNMENVGPTVGGELLRNALLALLLASAALIAYISYRFQFKFAVTALVPLLFDSFVLISAFSIFQVELNQPFVAVVLTIVGYSINATIVIFDRVRENLRHSASEKKLAGTVNLSVNQTVVRSIITSLTTLLVVGCLLFLGGETLTPFALPLFIGIISGTFSSIFIAAPLWYTWKLHEQKARA